MVDDDGEIISHCVLGGAQSVFGEQFKTWFQIIYECADRIYENREYFYWLRSTM